MDRRQFVRVVSAATAISTLGHTAWAQPAGKVVKVVVPFPAGGSADAMGRLLALHLQGNYAANVVVENRVGAGGRIGTLSVRNAEPDGTTMLVNSSTPMTLYPHVFNKLGYDVTKDFVSVCQLTNMIYGLAVGPAVPNSIQTLGELVAWLKQHPESAKFGGAGVGTGPHFLGLQVAKEIGIPLEFVPYNGGAPLAQAVLGGHLPISIDALASMVPHLVGGRMRVLATFGEQRVLPAVQTVREAGYASASLEDYYGLWVPAQTPPETVAKLAAAAQAATRQPAFVDAVQRLTMGTVFSPTSEFTQRVANDVARWGGMARAANFKPMD
ncbi:MAG: tripartite tricarboxylate transporter substrate-binding protein [Pseudomonadota bacterium]